MLTKNKFNVWIVKWLKLGIRSLQSFKFKESTWVMSWYYTLDENGKQTTSYWSSWEYIWGAYMGESEEIRTAWESLARLGRLWGISINDIKNI